MESNGQSITGKVIQVLPLQQGVSAASGKAWALQTFILETQEQYPRKVCIEIFGEQRIKDNPVQVDVLVTVNYDLESREFNGRWYTSVRAWKVGLAATTAPAAQIPGALPGTMPAAPAAAPIPTFDAAMAANQEEGSGLPF